MKRTKSTLVALGLLFAPAATAAFNSAAQGQQFFPRFELPIRPPAPVPNTDYSRPQPRRDTVIRQDLPPPAMAAPPPVIAPPIVIAPREQQRVTGQPAAPCDDSLRARFCIPKPEIIPDPRNMAEGQITIQDDEKALYLSLGNGQAVRYKVATAIEREKMPRGDYFLSSERGGEPTPAGPRMFGMIKNPQWCPTDNIRMQRGFARGYCVPGGTKENPFGIAAMYLAYNDASGKETQTLFRIHGTNQPEKIGENVSSGCVRMRNDDVTDLFDRVMDMRLRNIPIGIHVPQGPSREEYKMTQQAITARLRQQYSYQHEAEPNFYPRSSGPDLLNGPRDFIGRLFGGGPRF